jgi:hypothetical protein
MKLTWTQGYNGILRVKLDAKNPNARFDTFRDDVRHMMYKHGVIPGPDHLKEQAFLLDVLDDRTLAPTRSFPCIKPITQRQKPFNDHVYRVYAVTGSTSILYHAALRLPYEARGTRTARVPYLSAHWQEPASGPGRVSPHVREDLYIASAVAYPASKHHGFILIAADIYLPYAASLLAQTHIVRNVHLAGEDRGVTSSATLIGNTPIRELR